MFVLNEIVWQIASKFAIFLELEKPKKLFFVLRNFGFVTVDAVVMSTLTRASTVTNPNLLEMKNKYLGFLIPKI